ncbi:hypothetical protein MMPV_002011 [Pyropia vietnamensis]
MAFVPAAGRLLGCRRPRVAAGLGAPSCSAGRPDADAAAAVPGLSRRAVLTAAAAAAVAAVLPFTAGTAAAASGKKPVFEKTDSGLRYTDVKKGTGPYPGDGDLVIVDYIGYLSDGRVFDSSSSPGRKPLAIQIGKNTVIPGIEEAVLSMRQGGQRVVIVPPALGYGDRGVCLNDSRDECLVPPNAVIEYDLTLRRVSPSPI